MTGAERRHEAGRMARITDQPRQAPHRRDDYAAQWLRGWDEAAREIETTSARLPAADQAAGRAALARLRATVWGGAEVAHG